MTAQPPSGEINPYAPPTVSDSLLDLDEAGIGVWRDGDYLVLHKDAELPSICVRSGQPATSRVPLKVTWYRSAWQLRLDHLPLRVPMCQRWAFYSTAGRRVLLGVGLATIALVLAICLLGEEMSRRTFQVALFLGLSVLITALLGSAALGEPIYFVRAKGNYLWFRGANERFLQQLPEWNWGSPASGKR